MSDQENKMLSAEAATQALRDSVTRARQMVWDAKRALEKQQEPDRMPGDAGLVSDEA